MKHASTTMMVVYVVLCLSVLLGSPSCVSGARDLTKWPFANWSIWNLPIGKDAKYVRAGIKEAVDGMTVDPDILVLSPSSPMTPVYFNSDAWTGRSRCTIEGKVLFEVPFPTGYIIPGAGKPAGTPNNSGALLDRDGVTIHQAQPMAHCTASGPVTAWVVSPNVTLNGDGIRGAHGGSGLSSMGGTIRLGELIPNAAPIRHALKIELDDRLNYYPHPGFRWPAVKYDGPNAGYNGSNPALMQGSLLALAASLNISSIGLETQPAKMLAWTLQNYGAYIVDSAGGNVYCLCTEQSNLGSVEEEFTKAWGYGISEWKKDTPWSRDINKLYLALSVVDNWNEDLYNTVKASNGAQGAGGGEPLQPWAPAA